MCAKVRLSLLPYLVSPLGQLREHCTGLRVRHHHSMVACQDVLGLLWGLGQEVLAPSFYDPCLVDKTSYFQSSLCLLG